MASSFNPSAAAGPHSGLFGLKSSSDSAGVHVLGVPFDATTSFRKGAARGPAAILAASHQVDLFDAVTGKPYEAGIWMAPLDPLIEGWNREASILALLKFVNHDQTVGADHQGLHLVPRQG